jgi:lipopolysaccharide biosynthesis glycosyltransferase
MFSPFGKNLMPAFRERNIPVFMTCDGKFLPHAMTAAASVLANGARSNRYDIVVIVHDIEADDLAAASEWARRFDNASLRFLDAGECLDLRGMGDFHVTDTFPLTVYFRLFAPDIFPNYDTILYLDSDLVALADVAELLRHDLGSALVAAGHDFGFEDELRNPYSLPGTRFLENAARCGVEYSPGDPYFNSGVMVMNLRAMREEETLEQFLNALCRMKEPMLPDQDILNLVCKGRVKFIDPAWNRMEWMEKPERLQAKILHFSGKKPWDFRYSGGNGGCYWLYSGMSPQQFHRRVADALIRQSTLSANIKSIVRLSFHLARCLVLPPFAGAARREKFVRRKREYRLDMRALFRHWQNMAALRRSTVKRRIHSGKRFEHQREKTAVAAHS